MRLTVLFLGVLMMVGCRKGEFVQPAKSYTSYLPLEVGNWIEYDVTSIIHTNLGSDTSSYILMEKYTESFIDNSGNTAYRVERYWKDSISGTFVIKDIWYANKNNDRAEKIEENVRFTKLIFPISLSKKWNGNAFNTLEKWDYTYDSLHINKSYNNLLFDSTVTVNQIDNVNPFQRQQAYEVYANHIGLVRKSYINISNDIGEELQMTVRAYSVE